MSRKSKISLKIILLINMHCTLYTVHCTLYTVNCTLYTVHCTLYTVHHQVANIKGLENLSLWQRILFYHFIFKTWWKKSLTFKISSNRNYSLIHQRSMTSGCKDIFGKNIIYFSFMFSNYKFPLFHPSSTHHSFIQLYIYISVKS